MALYELGKIYYYSSTKYIMNRRFEYLGALLGIDYEYIIAPNRTDAYLKFRGNRTVYIQYITGTFKEINGKCLFTEEEKVAYEKEKKLVEPKEGFSIHGKILYYGEHYYIRREDTSFRELGKLNTYIDDGIQAIMTFTPVENKLHIPLNHIHRLYTRKEMLELVEPKEDKPSKVVYDYRGHDNILNLLMGMSGAIIIVDQKDYCDSELRNHARSRNIDLVMYVDRRKETLNQDPFNLNPHEFDETKTPFSDSLDSMAYILEQIEKPFAPFPYYHMGFDEAHKDVRDKTISTLISKSQFLLHEDIRDSILYGRRFQDFRRTQPQPPKNRIPDRVVFNQDKGKVTVLISKHLDGVAPYWAYTVKTSENDKYDAIFGFMLAYFKYLNRSLEPKEQKAVIERVFKMSQTKRFPYLMGVVEQELLKLLGTTIKVEEIILAITSPNADMNYINVTWDYAEWKEMLRVHELETKREEQKAIRKEIKKHEQEIEKLKKKGV